MNLQYKTAYYIVYELNNVWFFFFFLLFLVWI